jgi:hypothetical protein
MESHFVSSALKLFLNTPLSDRQESAEMVIKIVRVYSLLLCLGLFLSLSGGVCSGKATGRKRRGEQYASAGAAMGALREKQLGLGILSALGHRLKKSKLGHIENRV